MWNFIYTYNGAITAISTIVYTFFTIILVWITNKNIRVYRDDKKIDEDKKLAITQLQNLYKLTDILAQYKTINENLSQFAYQRSILYTMLTYTGQKELAYLHKDKSGWDSKGKARRQKDLDYINKATRASEFKELLELEEFQTQTIEDYISIYTTYIQKNFDIAEANVEQVKNKSNELNNKRHDLNTEIQMHYMLLPIQAINIHHNHLYNFFSDIENIYIKNKSNIQDGNRLTPYPADDFIIDIKATLALNLKYIHNTDNFSLEKWQKNWQKGKIEETKDTKKTANPTNTTPPTN